MLIWCFLAEQQLVLRAVNLRGYVHALCRPTTVSKCIDLSTDFDRWRWDFESGVSYHQDFDNKCITAINAYATDNMSYI